MQKPNAKKLKWVLIGLFIVWGASLAIRFGAYFDAALMVTLAAMIYANE